MCGGHITEDYIIHVSPPWGSGRIIGIGGLEDNLSTASGSSNLGGM